MTKEKENTHLIIKLEWIENNLNDIEQALLSILLEKATKDIPEHKYYIVNIDEPYANEVADIIEKYTGDKVFRNHDYFIKQAKGEV